MREKNGERSNKNELIGFIPFRVCLSLANFSNQIISAHFLMTNRTQPTPLLFRIFMAIHCERMCDSSAWLCLCNSITSFQYTHSYTAFMMIKPSCFSRASTRFAAAAEQHSLDFSIAVAIRWQKTTVNFFPSLPTLLVVRY